MVVLSLSDMWLSDLDQQSYFDNFYLGTTQPAAGASGAVTYAESIGLDAGDATNMIAMYNATGVP